MGSAIFNLQFLDVEEESVRAAVSNALAGRWSERFVTAVFPPTDDGWMHFETLAARLSKKLDCTLLSVTSLDSGYLSLMICQRGRRTIFHRVDERGFLYGARDFKSFCDALGISRQFAPDLKCLSSDSDQEEKLRILSSLLGAPLCASWDAPEALEFVTADSGPLAAWVAAHAKPQTRRNQCRAELLQEIPARGIQRCGDVLLLRPLAYADQVYPSQSVNITAGERSMPDGRTVRGYLCSGGEWARPLPDGRLALVPLVETEPAHGGLEYAALGERLLTYTANYTQDFSFPNAYAPQQSILLHDSAGVIPTPFFLTLDGAPAVAGIRLLPDGGFLAEIRGTYDSGHPSVQTHAPGLARFAPDGKPLWSIPGITHVIRAGRDCIYAVRSGTEASDAWLCALSMDGSALSEYPIPFSPYSTQVLEDGGMLYLLQPSYQDSLLHRLTPDLKPDGRVSVFTLSSLAFTPDHRYLYCAGSGSGLQILDLKTLRILHEQRNRHDYFSPIADRDHRLWVGSGAYMECYSPSLTLLSRHRLKGELLCSGMYRNANGEVCVATHHSSSYTTRVYRLY